MRGKKSKAVREYADRVRIKIIKDFLTGEEKELNILYCVDCIKKYKFINRLKIALSILRGEK